MHTLKYHILLNINATLEPSQRRGWLLCKGKSKQKSLFWQQRIADEVMHKKLSLWEREGFIFTQSNAGYWIQHTYSFISPLCKIRICRLCVHILLGWNSAKCMKAPDHLIITSSTRCLSSQDDRHSFIVFQLCAILQIVPVQWGGQRLWQPLMERTNNITALFLQSNQNPMDKIKSLFFSENSVSVRNTSH